MNLRRNLAATAVLVLPLLAQEATLLTDNGLNNAEHNEYADAQLTETVGCYRVTPAFSVDEEMVAGKVPFAKGRLTNGDSTFNYRRTPGPYAYWQGLKRGEVEFDLLKPCRIRKVRVCILNSGPHGIARIELFAKGDPLEFPEALRLGKKEAVNGWNTFDGLNRLADGVRFVFEGARDKNYITVSEVEIWGEPVPGATVPVSPKKLSGKSIRDGEVEWYAFDFGPPSAPTFANFTGVSQNTVYTAERGYGWVPYRDGKPGTPSNFEPESAQIPGLGQRDRAAKRGSSGDSMYRDFVCSCEYYHTQVRQTFAIDVPNGNYRVVTFHGDQVYGRRGVQSWWIEAEGERVVEGFELPPSLMGDAVFDVTVADGQLTLTFDAANDDPARRGFSLNGVAVIPAGTKESRLDAERRIGRIQAAIARERDEIFRREFAENPYVEERKMPAVSEADRKRGFVAFAPHWMTNVYPNSVPTPEDCQRSLACFACPGESEPVSVAVRALRDVPGLRCTVRDLRGPGTIPGRAVEVRAVRCWPQRLGSSWSTEWRVMPELLEKRDTVDLSANTAQQFWLTVRVPDKAAPGLYTGSVTLEADGSGTKVELPLTVEVLPFVLRPSERTVGMYWRDGKVAGNHLRDAQIRDMLEHGVTAVTMGGLFPELTNDDGRLILDTSELKTFLQDLHRLGIRGPIPYHISSLSKKIKRAFPDLDNERLDDLYVEAVRQLQEVSAQADTPQLLYYPVDEIGNHDDRGRKAHHECALVARVPGAVSYITVNNYAAGEKWGDTFDIWCGNIVYTEDQEKKLLDKGKRYMRYGSAYLNDPRKARSSCGFGFYRRPAEAMYYWHYQATVGDPNNDFDGSSRDWCAAYPGADGELVPTTDWEGIREGVDDLRYIATLEHLAQRADHSETGKAAAERARRVLASVLENGEGLSQTAFGEDMSTDDYHHLRRRLVDAILELLPHAR